MKFLPSSLDLQIIWKSLCLGSKKFYFETLYREFLSSKFDTVSTSSVKKSFAFRLYSDVDTTPWTLNLIESVLDWSAKRFMLIHFIDGYWSSKIDEVSTSFFVDQLSQKLTCLQNVIQS